MTESTTPRALTASELHQAIMNLPVKITAPARDTDPVATAYCEGCRDTRHAAAELALALQAVDVGELAAKERQSKVLAWAVENFGDIAKNRDERAIRLAEEAIEVAQAEGVSLELIHRVAERVYSRPVGEIGREIGGVAITLDALAENLGRNAYADGNVELTRILSKPKDWWQRKHQEKVEAGTADLSPLRRPAPATLDRKSGPDKITGAGVEAPASLNIPTCCEAEDV
jgi:hypothetical protein